MVHSTISSPFDHEIYTIRNRTQHPKYAVELSYIIPHATNFPKKYIRVKHNGLYIEKAWVFKSFYTKLFNDILTI